MARKFNHFQRGGKPTFECDVCGRRTRDTGQGVDHLCMDCYELAGMDNHCNDAGETPEQAGYAAEAAARLANIAKLGGDVEKVKACNGYLFPVGQQVAAKMNQAAEEAGQRFDAIMAVAEGRNLEIARLRAKVLKYDVDIEAFQRRKAKALRQIEALNKEVAA